MNYFLRYLLPGLGLILLAFVMGAQKDPVFGLLGFLPFFTLGVLLIIYGRDRPKEP